VSAATGADRLEVAPAAALVGELAVPGDKSISHRALLLGAVADGTTEVSGFGANADTLATLAAVESLGARVERLDESTTRLRVHGCGLRGLERSGRCIGLCRQDFYPSQLCLRRLAGGLRGCQIRHRAGQARHIQDTAIGFPFRIQTYGFQRRHL